jgi:penicillin-binding protein 1A
MKTSTSGSPSIRSRFLNSGLVRGWRRFRAERPFVSGVTKWSGLALLGLLFYWFVIETNFLYLTGEMPDTDDLANPELAVSSELYTADGKLLSKYYTENRTPVDTITDLPLHLIEALVATEDARFYEHNGIDPRAMAGVAVGMLSGGDRGGGSTITQQLAKNLFKIRRKQGVARKGLLGYVPYLSKFVVKSKEWVTALKLERRYPKDKILVDYLNTVDYGSNAYGIKVAARTFFNKSPDSLSVQESAVLVGLQKATTTYNPHLNPERSKDRRNVVLGQMAKYGYLTEAEADSIAELPLVTTDPRLVQEQLNAMGYEGYFKRYVSDFLNDWAEKNEERLDLYTDGLKIITTIDSRLQTHAEEAVAESMKRLQRTFNGHWGRQNPWIYENGQEIPAFIDSVAKRTEYFKVLSKRFPNQPDSVWHYLKKEKRPMKVFSWDGEKSMEMTAYDSIAYYKRFLQAGMVSMESATGQIKAWVGGLDYKYFKYDHVRQARRQPGSTFKPILYAAAIDGPRDLSPCFTIKDQPFRKEYEEDGEIKVWQPQNADGYFSYSNMSLRQALARSINSVAAQLTDLVTPDTVVQYAKKLGVTSPLAAVPSIGLGSSDVSLYDMVRAYAPFVNGGYRVDPVLVLRVEDREGNVIVDFSENADKNRERVLREESAFLMRFMLQGGLEGGGTSSRLLWDFKGLRSNERTGVFGAKTGTTSNYSDGWFMAVTHNLVTGVWVGGDDRSIHFRGRGGEGAATALPIYKTFMEHVVADPSLATYRPKPFPKPEQMRLAVVKEYNCAYTYTPRAESDSTSVEGGDSTYVPPVYDPILNPDTTGLGN